MRKPVLGKGLRSLLNGTRIPGRPGEPIPTAESLDQTSVSPGLDSLLRGEAKPASQLDPESAAPAANANRLRQNWAVVKWILVAADLLLLTLTTLLVFKNSGRLTWVEWALCILSLTIGAALAVLSVLGRFQGTQ